MKSIGFELGTLHISQVTRSFKFLSLDASSSVRFLKDGKFSEDNKVAKKLRVGGEDIGRKSYRRGSNSHENA